MTSFGTVMWGYIPILIYIYVMYKVCRIKGVISAVKKHGYYEATKPGSAASKDESLKMIAKSTAIQQNPKVMVLCDICHAPFKGE